MQYIYGTFSEKQIKEAVRAMHGDIHKLLLYKDNNFKEKIFENDKDFYSFFNKLLYRFGGVKTLFNDNLQMVKFMATLQSAYNISDSENFNYSVFRRAILDCHGYLKNMFEGGEDNAEFSGVEAHCLQ